MKIQTNKNNKKTTPILLGALLLVATVAGTFYYMHHFQVGLFTPKKQASSSEQKTPAIVNYNPTTDQEKSAGNAIKEQGASANSSTPPPSQETTTVPVDITSASQNGSVVYIRSVIHTTTSEGSCSLTMKGPNDKVYTASAQVQPLSSTSTCAGFNIPTSSLSPGQWSIAIKFTNNNTVGSAQSSIEVK